MGMLILICTAVLGLLLLLFILQYVYVPPRAPLASELTFTTPNTRTTPSPLPTLSSPAEIVMSVVVPAYNEESRIKTMLAEAVHYLDKTYLGNSEWEILIVDDGSTDETSEVALDWAAELQDAGAFDDGQVRVCRLEKNRGKGGAVSHGMQHVRGEYVIFADADGASKFHDLERLERELKTIERDNLGIAVGSRAHMVHSAAVVQRSFIRNFTMYGFHTFLHFIGIRAIKDTQCGFKLFTRRSSALIFPSMHVERWAFDVECLYLAERQGIPMIEVPVTWHEVQSYLTGILTMLVPGSKLSLAKDSLLIALDLIHFRLNYTLGIWKIGKAKAD